MAPDITYIETSYISIGCLKRRFSFPYSDAFFASSSVDFNPDLAKSSLGLAVSADRDPDISLEEQHRTVESFLSGAGFGDLCFFRFNSAPDKDTAALAIGKKEIGGNVIVSLAVCGNGYGDEWIGNLTAGCGQTHLGFKTASECILKDVSEYLRKIAGQGEPDHAGKKVKIWAAGYSRAAAILSLVLPVLQNTGHCSEVYGYLFATVPATLNAGPFPGIFNILNPSDPFVNFCSYSSNHGRNGTDIILQTENDFKDSSKDGGIFLSKIQSVADALGCKVFRTSSYIDDFFSKVMGYWNTVCRDFSDYHELFEEVFIGLYKKHSRADCFKAFIRIRRNVKRLLSKERKKVFGALVRSVIKEAVFFRRTKKRLIRSGEWLSSERVDTNILREHAGDMYVSRVFANW